MWDYDIVKELKAKMDGDSIESKIASELHDVTEQFNEGILTAEEYKELLVDAKHMIINKMNQAGHINTFLRTNTGFKVTGVEGFVAIDRLSGGAVKLVNRMEFSKANFSPDIIKGWEK